MERTVCKDRQTGPEGEREREGKPAHKETPDKKRTQKMIHYGIL